MDKVVTLVPLAARYQLLRQAVSFCAQVFAYPPHVAPRFLLVEIPLRRPIPSPELVLRRIEFWKIHLATGECLLMQLYRVAKCRGTPIYLWLAYATPNDRSKIVTGARDRNRSNIKLVTALTGSGNGDRIAFSFENVFCL